MLRVINRCWEVTKVGKGERHYLKEERFFICYYRIDSETTGLILPIFHHKKLNYLNIGYIIKKKEILKKKKEN